MWQRILHYTITTSDHQKTIHEFLKAHGYSASVIRHMKETENGIQKNGIWARVHESILPGDTLTLILEENTSSEHIMPSPLPLHIVYEDDDLLVINKDAGVPIHPSQGNFDNTLANACAYYFAQKGEPFTYRCINRLDRDTTGLLIIARHAYSASLLSDMVAKKEIHREYLALAAGLVPDQGVIDAPIGRVADSTIEREVNYETGDAARTNFKRLAYYEPQNLSLVSLILETGRTHQIRVHMAYIGHPVAGDAVYGSEKQPKICQALNGQCLHAKCIGFVHPVTGENLYFESDLPTYFTDFIQKLQ